MRVQHFSTLDYLPEALRDFLRRRFSEFFGVGLLVLTGALAVALVTWSAHDPSFNHAVDRPVRNLLGHPGAIVADIVTQLVGLSSVALITPMAFWGWILMSYRRLPNLRVRLVCWLIGCAAAAGFASLLPVTDRWPLPTGLGGVVGDAILALPRKIAGGSGLMMALTAIALAAIAILALSAAARVGQMAPSPDDDFDDMPMPAPKKSARQVTHEEDDAEGEPGLGLISAGALIHAALMTKAALARQIRAWKNRPKSEARPDRAPWLYTRGLDAPEDENQGFAGPVDFAGRREPGFASRATAPQPLAPVASVPDPLAPAYFDPNAYAGDQAFAPQPVPSMAQPAQRQPAQAYAPAATPMLQGDFDPPPSQRVTPAQPSLKAGKRVVREAQPSFLDRGEYQLPPLHMLSEPKKLNVTTISEDALEQNARLLEGVLDDFSVRGEIIQVRPGPVVTLYELEPAPGIKSSRVIGLADDIARSMSAISARVAVVSGRNAIGIELPNAKRETVYLRELLASEDFEKSKHKLAIALGKTIGGEPVIVDLAKMPHLLVAGTTGSGKSVAINTMILSLLYRLKPEECRLIMVDPKMLELSVYEGIPHLLTPVVTDVKKAVVALKWAVREMEDRYKKMAKVGVRNIDNFNQRVAEAKAKGEVITRTVQTGFDRETGEAIYEHEEMDLSVLPYIVVIVDEMADMMIQVGKEVEGTIQRLAQMARAAGIHLIMATQRPSVDVVTGTIKANFPTRISFQVTSKIDSRTILGEQGAEQLLGQGDMLYMAGGGRISRVHGPFVSDQEVEKIVAHLKTQGQPDYLDAITADDELGEDGAAPAPGSMDAEESGDLYDRAVAIVLRDKKCSTSYVQRRLSIGYNKAASLVERMEQEGVVGPANHAGKREILVGGGIDRGAFDLGADE
ncbi:DNA translocase FtsK [Methylovirgula sp. 4M-Z18]|uniref:DNA translocase FtsK n=1 Tax=Methylovirgula sp. 4M-Z18 TaxID=2293567 RepID=UPI000E2E9B3D|nr:DNA translocase FtsK [Methylovirgula sp. 4M-Z18]RFB79379.1 DNA translocase FtsK [Methylovirgula sp. 4M-Z18]